MEITQKIADQMAKIDSTDKMETFKSLVSIPGLDDLTAREAFELLEEFRSNRADEIHDTIEIERKALELEALEY